MVETTGLESRRVKSVSQVTQIVSGAMRQNLTRSSLGAKGHPEPSWGTTWMF